MLNAVSLLPLMLMICTDQVTAFQIVFNYLSQTKLNRITSLVIYLACITRNIMAGVKPLNPKGSEHSTLPNNFVAHKFLKELFFYCAKQSL